MMKLAIYTKDGSLLSQERFVAFEKALRASGNDVYRISSGEDLAPETEMILSVGGDGTFLSAAKRAGGSGASDRLRIPRAFPYRIFRRTGSVISALSSAPIPKS